VWSAAPDVALEYPARYLFAFLDNHGMLSVTGSPAWRTVVGGSRVYVERAAKNLTAVEVGTPVRSVRRHADGVDVRDDAGQVATFDRVVLATHADTALARLENPSEDQRRLLGAFGYSRNETVLHTDPSLLPRAVAARSSWNYLLPSCDSSSSQVLVSYDMNRLQRLSTGTPYVVTLNATARIDPDRVLARMSYEHPVLTRESVGVPAELPGLNDGTLAFAGAYQGWGFHEDGCRSGVAAAASLGAQW
jgi:predicted NAD/FAD-binding protein